MVWAEQLRAVQYPGLQCLEETRRCELRSILLPQILINGVPVKVLCVISTASGYVLGTREFWKSPPLLSGPASNVEVYVGCSHSSVA